MNDGERYRELTQFLLEADPVETAHGGWEVLRVGRNPVWKVRADSRTLYVKVMRDPLYYRRERHGLNVAQELALRHEWIAAPQLVYTDETKGALVTTALPGVGVGRLLRAAFRMDRNPVRRRAPIQRAIEGLSSALRWLEELNGVPVTNRDLLFDHTVARIRDRVLGKIRRGVEHGVLSVREEALTHLAQLDVGPAGQPELLLCGDATLGNFLWDGRRIGRVDFEDFGFGAPERDHSEIRQGLELVARKPWYWSVDQALAMLPPAADPVRETLYRLEWAIDRHWPGKHKQPTKRMRVLERGIQDMLAAITTAPHTRIEA